MNSRTATFGCLMALTIASAAASGVFANRWGTSQSLAKAAERLALLPDQIGPWEKFAEKELDSETLEILECAGSLVRSYRHRANPNRVVRMALLAGPPGPLSVHTPEICYSARDYTIERAASHFSVAGVGSLRHELWSMTLKGNDVEGQALEVAYAWNAGDGWQAPREARFSFGGQRCLYKIQVAADLETSVGRKSEERSICREFLEDCLPLLDTQLFSDASAR